MKQHFYYVLLISFLLKSMSINAQNNDTDCDSNLNKAITYLKTKNYTQQDSIKAVKLLKPCIKNGNAYSQLLMGRLYLESNLEEHHKKGFKLIKKAAKQDLAIACSDLADLFKYGLGCELDLSKAKKWYKKAHQLGDTKGTFGLAYMHYKGLGGLNQNYSEAIKLFKKSDYPMANHWLAVSYYFGYGVEKDTNKALRLLENNNLKNSEIMLDCMKFHLKNEQDLLNETGINTALILNDEVTSSHNFYPEQLNGNWTGSLIQLDWSSKKILQTFPITLSLNYNATEETTKYKWSSNGIETESTALNDNNTLLFENLNANISRLYFSDEKEQHINYTIQSGNFALKTHEDKTYLTALLDSYSIKMSEPGNRFALLLTKKEEVTENGKNISADIALGLQEQDHFIKLYPNPLQNELYISYDLKTNEPVQVEVSDLYGGKKQVLANDKQQKAGNHTYYFDSSNLKKGMHVVSIIVNGEKNTRLIIKN